MHRHHTLDNLVILFNVSRRMRRIAIEVVRNHMQPDRKATSLIQATNNRDITTITLLLYAGGFNVDSKDNTRYTSLMNITSSHNRNNKSEIVKLLLEAGANPNKEDNEGITALNYEVRHRNVEVVRMLLDYGARINDNKLYGLTIIDNVIKHNLVDIIKLLIPKITNKTYINKLLIYAMDYNHNINPDERIDLVRLLLDYGANPNVDFDHFYSSSTLLIRASAHGWVEIIKLLLDYGADINAIDSYGSTALMSGINENNPNKFDTVKILLDYGADMNVTALSRHNIPYTALKLAQIKGYEDIAKLFIKKQKQKSKKRRNLVKKQTKQRKKIKRRRRRKRQTKDRSRFKINF
tara:strand:- start:252 stop:1304 length:1053 start_codon:yes stop_codon:yes gene_type:complete